MNEANKQVSMIYGGRVYIHDGARNMACVNKLKSACARDNNKC